MDSTRRIWCVCYSAYGDWFMDACFTSEAAAREYVGADRLDYVVSEVPLIETAAELRAMRQEPAR